MPRGEAESAGTPSTKKAVSKQYKKKAQEIRKNLIKDSGRDLGAKKVSKKKKAKKALLAKEGQNAANDEPRRGAAGAVTKHVTTKGEMAAIKAKEIQEHVRQTDRKQMNRNPTSHNLVVVPGGQVIVVADQPPAQVLHCSDFNQEQIVTMGRAFGFDQHGEDLKYIYLNEHIPFRTRIWSKVGATRVAQYLFEAEKEEFYQRGHNYIVLSNKHLYTQDSKKIRKVALQSITKVDVLPGNRKGHETTVKFGFWVEGVKPDEKTSSPKKPLASPTSQTRGSLQAQPSIAGKKEKNERVLEVHFHRDTAANFIVAKVMSFLEKKENILLRTLKVKTVHHQLHRRGAPDRKASDVTDVSGKGYLELLSKGDKWKKQYFMLAGEWLYYFASEKAEKPSGFIDLVPDECVIQKEGSEGPVFTISTLQPSEGGRTPCLRTFSLRAVSEKKGDDEKESEKWIITLVEHTNRLRKRINLQHLIPSVGDFSEEHVREGLTKHCLEFVKGDKKTGPLSEVCREWKEWYNGRETRKEFAHTPKLVIDLGASVWRAGFAEMTKERPDIVIPIAPYPDDDFRQVHKQRLETSFRTLFAELSVTPEDCYVLVTKPLRAHRDWEKAIKHILFDTFQFRALAIVDSAAAVGEACDLVEIKSFLLVDVGSRGARLVPVIEGHIMEAKSNEFPHLSQDAPTNEILSWLCPRSTSLKLNPSQATELARLIKEQYVCCDENNKRLYDEWAKKYHDRPMTKIEEMADTEECRVGGRSFKIPKYVLWKAGELLFRPKELLGDDDDSLVSIQEAVWKIAEGAERVNVAALISRIVVTGGGAKIKGFSKRLVKELDLLIAEKRKGQATVEEENSDEELDEQKLAEKEIEEEVKKGKPKAEQLKVQPFVQEFNIPDQSDLVWFGANYCADSQKCHNEKFWTPNPAHPELDLEEEEEGAADDEDEEDAEEE